MDGFDEFRVVVNAEGQHSLWPVALEVPHGWTVSGEAGSRDECLEYIETRWPDIRPLSLRSARV